MASSATSATSFELIEDQTLTAEEVEMASQEAQEIRTREAAVVAGGRPGFGRARGPPVGFGYRRDEGPLRLRVAFATPTSGLGAPGPAEEEDKDMDVTERAKKGTDTTHEEAEGFRGGFPEDHVNKPVSLVLVEGRPGYFKLVDLPDLFPVLPASAATLLRAVSLFHKFVGKNLTEDLVIRILEAYVPMKIQIRQEEVWASQFQRNKACIGTQQMHRLDGSAQTRSSSPWPRWYPGTGRPQPGGRHGPGESSSENGHGRGDHRGRRGPAQQAGGHPAGDPVHGGGRQGVEGPGMPGDQGQSAAVPEGGGGSELPALPPPGGPGDPEEGGAA